MDLQNDIHLLLRRLISVFALMDGWIDRWQREDPETLSSQFRFSVLSDVINALAKLCHPFSKDISAECTYFSGNASSSIAESQVPQNANEMRTALRTHLAELLWLLDQHEAKHHDKSRNANGEDDRGIIDTATNILEVMSEYLERLEAPGKPVGNLSSEPQHRVCPE